MNKTLIVLVSATMLLIGCTKQENVSDNISRLSDYLTIRYDGITSENFYGRIELMSDYYTTEMKLSDSWVVNQMNLDETYNILKRDHIESDILFIDIQEVDIYKYNAVIIVQYNTVDVHNTFCTEYHLAFDLKENKIENVENLKQNSIIVGANTPVIENGEIVGLHTEYYEHECDHTDH